MASENNNQTSDAAARAWGHLRTITKHKILVGELCFKAGLYKQGLLHDLSKYSPVEFAVGARYFTGNKSPNVAERLEKGVSESWLHHKGRNKHHFEYWMDVRNKEDMNFRGRPMPTRYVVEMLCDRIAACKVYQGDAYTQASALNYYLAQPEYNSLMHPDTAALLEAMLRMVAELGEDEALAIIKRDVVQAHLTYGEHGRF